MLLACTCIKRAAGFLALSKLLKKWRRAEIRSVNNTCLRMQPIGTNGTVAFNLTQRVETGPISLKCQAGELNESKTRLVTLIIVRTKLFLNTFFFKHILL